MSAPVTLSFPADPEYLRLARLAAADAGSRAGFDVDDIDDVRIAVSELCGSLVGATRVTLTMSVEAGVLEVHGEADVALTPVLDGLTRTVVRGVVDDYELATDPVGAFRFVKRPVNGESRARATVDSDDEA